MNFPSDVTTQFPLVSSASEISSELSLSEKLDPLIESTIQRLNRKVFKPDPIAGEHFSRIVSIMSSAYKRHGHILERAILEQLRTCPHLTVWNDPLFHVSANADMLANSSLHDPKSGLGSEVQYGVGTRTIQVDVLVFDKRKNSLSAYEIKRGFGAHDAGKKRSILRDTLCLNVLLKSYGRSRELEATSTSAQVIFYYGVRSLPKPFSLIGSELDEHFDWPVYSAVEEINKRFKAKLFSILSA